MLNESSTVQELLAEIRAKKERLIKEKKIKKAKPLPPIDNDEQPFEIPNNWKWVRLGDIATIITGTTPSKKEPSYYGGNFPFYKPSNIQSNKYLYPADEYLSELGKAQARFIPKNSIAVNCIGNIGKAAMFPTDGTTNQQINSICHYLYPEYLYWVCQSDFFITQLLDFSSATTISIVNKSKVERTIIPLPPLFEQHRLVARIESLFAKLDAAREKVQSVLDSHETRKAALLHDAFTGKLTAKWREEHQTELRESKQFPSKLKSAPNHANALAGKWALVRLGDVVTWSSGGTPSRKHPEYYSGDIPWVKTGELNNTYIYDTTEKITKDAIAQSSAKVLPVNTVLLAMYGATIGKVGILGVEAATNQACACGICSEWVDYRFLFYYLQSQKSSFIRSGKGGAQPNISQTIIKQHDFPLPSLPEQQEIVRILDCLLAREQRARQAAEETLTAIDRMKQSILARAFRGEL